jgi:hypothetical protein
VQARISISNSRQVNLNRVQVSNAKPGVSIAGSTVTMTDCSITGAHATLVHGIWPAENGLTVSNSTLIVSHSVVTGGNGLGTGPGLVPSAPAIAASNSEVFVHGDRSTLMAAGILSNGPVAAIQANGGSITVDPNVVLFPEQNAQPIGGTAQVSIQRMPGYHGTGAGPGGTVRCELFSRSGDFAVFMTSLAAYPTPTLNSMIWLDLNGWWQVTSIAIQGSSERLASDIVLPNDPNLSGPAFVTQALSGNLTTGWQLSNPVFYALH